MTYERVRGGIRILGAKKGGSGSTVSAQELPDSLKSTTYAKILDLLGEGEYEGLVDGLRSVYLNGTPVQNSDGSLNFEGVTFDFRYGTQDQTYIQGFPAAERPYSIGVTLKRDQPWVRYITDKQLSAVRVMVGTNRLTTQDTSNGNLSGGNIQYKIELQTGEGPWQTYLTSGMTGKTTSSYRRSHRIDLPRLESGTGWAVRVSKLTEDSTSSAVSNDMVVDLFTEVIDAKMRYPMSVLAGITIDAQQFGSSVPTRAYRLRMRRIRVPSNYDAYSHTYTGSWDGSFKISWSNNPAWVFYDLLTNDVFGLARRIPQAYIDKFSLYQIGRYCDEAVPDGRGGTEPRFTCNVFMQKEAEAFKVLQDFVSIFRGMVFWSHGTAVTVADMPQDPEYTYTQSNVVDGKFMYTGSRLSDMYTSVSVSYSDVEDFGRQKVITVVADDDIIARYGFRPTEVTAFGCTSEGQARRQGEWVLMTAHEQSRGVTFTVGLEGHIASPGKVIRVADNLIAGRRIGGRLLGGDKEKLVLEAATKVSVGSEITVLMPSGVSETRVIVEVQFERATIDTTKILADTSLTTDTTQFFESYIEYIKVDKPFSEVPYAETIWALDTQELKTQLFTVTAVTESTTAGQFDITAIQHAPGKYDKVDYGSKLDDRPITVVPPKVVPAPESVDLSEYSVVHQGITRTVGVIEWSSVAGATSYIIQWRRDNSEWVNVPAQYGTRLEIEGLYAGVYSARVCAVNTAGFKSAWKQSALTALTGVYPAPPEVTHLLAESKVFGIELKWGYPSSSHIIERVQLYVSSSYLFEDATLLTDLSYPQNTYNLTGLAAGVERWFWARYIDKNGLAGPIYPVSTGVRGTASSDSEAVLTYLANKIGETQLAENILATIESGGGANVALETVRSELAAMYTIKTALTVDGKRYIAGIGVGVEDNGGTPESQVLVAADRFAVIHPNGTGVVVPFVVQNGQVFIANAFIQNASISSAKIAEWLESDAVNSLGQKVWRLNMRTGAMEFNGAGGASGRLTISNNLIQIFDANRLRVRMGLW